MSRLRKISLNLIKGLLIMLSLAYFANSAFFSHTHILESGEIITHAHPFNKDASNNNNNNQHQHSKAEFILFNQVSLDLLLLNIITFSAFLFLITILSEKTKAWKFSMPELLSNSRAPPF